jgi:hypothetical protein
MATHLARHLHWRLLGSASHGGYVLLFDYTNDEILPEEVYALLNLSPPSSSSSSSSLANIDSDGFPKVNLDTLSADYRLPTRRLLTLLRVFVDYFQCSNNAVGNQSDHHSHRHRPENQSLLRAIVHERHGEGSIGTELRIPLPSHHHLLWINPSLRTLSPPLTPTTVVHIENHILFRVIN